MIKNQIMNRELGKYIIRQRTEDKFFCATDLLTVYNQENPNKQKRLYDFENIQDTKEFCIALANDLNSEGLNNEKTRYLESDFSKAKKWKYWWTWMHPYLYVKFAMWLSKELEVKVIKWIYDNLIEFRNEAWDYYKEMCSVIQNRYQIMNKKTPDPLIFSTEANFINGLAWVNSWERNKIDEDKLKTISELQKAYINLANNWFNRYQIHEKLRDYLMMKPYLQPYLKA